MWFYSSMPASMYQPEEPFCYSSPQPFAFHFSPEKLLLWGDIIGFLVLQSPSRKKKYIFWKPLLYSVRSIICNSKRTPKFYLRRKLDLELGGCSIVLISNTKGKIYVRFKSGEEKSREMTTSTFVLCYKRQEQHRNMPKPLTETKSWHRNQRPDNISHLRYTFPSL